VSELQVDAKLVTRVLSDFIRLELAKFSFSRAVVGLSGGIDSTVVAYLCSRALGPHNVTGFLMPYKASSPESEADARLVVEELGINHQLVDITPQIDAYYDCFPAADRMRCANKMARERMTILYDHSAALEALVVGTSNKTEFLLGYTTLWGDMASAILPLGDLYKTQVRQLARYMKVPDVIIDKKPSADLWVGQTDEEEIGFSYAEMDRLLYRLVDLRCSREELAEAGFDCNMIDRVSSMIRNSQYKRRLPVIAKVSARSVDRDFRYPRDWGR